MDAEFLKSLRYAAATSVAKGNDGVDAFNKVIFSDDLPGEIATTQHCFIFSGPPRMEHGTANHGIDLTPVGLVTDLQLAGQRQIAPIAELGNRFYRHVAGRTNHSASMGRVLSKSANIIGMMYVWLLKGNPVFHQEPTRNQQPFKDASGKEANYSLHALSLDSDMLDIPFGLYVVKTNEDGTFMSACYWENCMIAGYTEQISTGQVMVMEQIQIVMSRVLPAPNLIGDGYQQHSFQLGGNFTGSGAADVNLDPTVSAGGSAPTLPRPSLVDDYPPPPGAISDLSQEEASKLGVADQLFPDSTTHDYPTAVGNSFGIVPEGNVFRNPDGSVYGLNPDDISRPGN